MTLFLTLSIVLIVVLLVVILVIQVRNTRQHREEKDNAQTQELMNEVMKHLEHNMRFLRDETTRSLQTFQSNLIEQAHIGRTEQQNGLKQFYTLQQQSLDQLMRGNKDNLCQIGVSLEQQLKLLRDNNIEKLEQMRQTVDEKLHETLERRLGESFSQVSEQLDRVQKGLGEMRTLATGVGDLKRVLTNVKTRGTWGEVQLGNLLGEVLIATQYDKNVETVSGSGERVEFAIRLPGKDAGNKPIWLPIDAKFPKEQYERLMLCAEVADANGVAIASKELERAIHTQAQTISKKYISPPETTDFALMFLPTEGLYAEVMRTPGLSDEVQRRYRVVISGPSTLAALLNSLQMGFKTLAIEKRSAEVWQVLSSVKTEFIHFSETLEQTKKSLESAAKKIEKTQIRTRAMNRQLKNVQALPETNDKDLTDEYAIEPSTLDDSQYDKS